MNALKDILPAEVVAASLRLYPDLAEFSDADLLRHYEMHGRSEGRVASPAATREGLLALAQTDRPILEIGPFANPQFRGENVEYLDVFDAAELKRRAEDADLDPDHCPDHIDYLDGLDTVPEGRFHIVFSSHAVEHQTDLIGHLKAAARALTDDGLYFLVIPDKRFCFDHFRAESSVGEILEAHIEGRQRHPLRHVVDQIAGSAHNDPHRHWAGDHGEPEGLNASNLFAALHHFEEAKGGYLDVHGWRLTPFTFRRAVALAYEMGLSPLAPLRVYDTPRGRFEFTAVLGRP